MATFRRRLQELTVRTRPGRWVHMFSVQAVRRAWYRVRRRPERSWFCFQANIDYFSGSGTLSGLVLLLFGCICDIMIVNILRFRGCSAAYDFAGGGLLHGSLVVIWFFTLSDFWVQKIRQNSAAPPNHFIITKIKVYFTSHESFWYRFWKNRRKKSIFKISPLEIDIGGYQKSLQLIFSPQILKLFFDNFCYIYEFITWFHPYRIVYFSFSYVLATFFIDYFCFLFLMPKLFFFRFCSRFL